MATITGISGNLAVESVVTFAWNRWQLSSGICTRKNEKGELLFDPGGGGDFINGKVINGGHVWFPQYETVKGLLEHTQFKDIEFYHYYDESGKAITKPIDYTIGHVMRTPDHDDRVKHPYRPLSIVVDCIK